MEITVCLNQEMKPGKPPPCFARSSYSLMDSFLISAPSKNLVMYRLYQISGNKRISKELEVAKQCTVITYSMYGRTSVRLLKIYNEMVRHSSTSNDIGLEAPAGARFPLNRLRLDPPFLGSLALYRGFGLCNCWL